MPRYNARDFSVRLYVWDAEQKPAPCDPRMLAVEPSIGHEIDEVSEEYFKNLDGINWLGDSPFYIINAGRELFYREPGGLEDLDEEVDQQGRDGEPKSMLDQALSASTPLQSGSISAGVQDSILSPAISPLTSVPSDFGSSPPPFDTPSQKKEPPRTRLRQDDALRGWLHNAGKPEINKYAVGKPLRKAVPLKIQCEFGKKTFLAINDKEQDLSINIFYNGEFVFAKTYRFATIRAATADEKRPDFSGRRTGITAEVPFMLIPLTADLDKLSNSNSGSNLDRWNQINALLLKEAENWVRDEDSKLQTCIGEYLEELSRFKMPSDMSNERVGRNIGIIDVSPYSLIKIRVIVHELRENGADEASKVVATLGRGMVNPNAECILQPHRKLECGQIGAGRQEVPQEPRSKLMKSITDNIRPVKPMEPPQNDKSLEHAPPLNAMFDSAQDTPTPTPPPMASRAPVSEEEYHITTVVQSAPIFDSPGVSDDLHEKRKADSSPDMERTAKRQKTQPAEEMSLVTDDPLASVMTPENTSSQHQMLDMSTNGRPARHRVKKRHFGDPSPTPAKDTSRNHTEWQTPTPSSHDGPAPVTRNETTGIGAAESSAGNYKLKMFGMDGVDDPFEFTFGFDGAGGKRSKGKGKAASSKNGTRSDALESISNTPTTSTTSKAPLSMSSNADTSALAKNQNEDYELPPLPTRPMRTRVSTSELKQLLPEYKYTDEIHDKLGSSFTDANVGLSTRSRSSRGKDKDANPEVNDSPAPSRGSSMRPDGNTIPKYRGKSVQTPVKPQQKTATRSQASKGKEAQARDESVARLQSLTPTNSNSKGKGKGKGKSKGKSVNDQLLDKLVKASQAADSPSVTRPRARPSRNSEQAGSSSPTPQEQPKSQAEEYSEDELAASGVTTSRDLGMTSQRTSRSAQLPLQATPPLLPTMNHGAASSKALEKPAETLLPRSARTSKPTSTVTPTVTIQSSMGELSGTRLPGSSNNQKAVGTSKPKPNIVINTSKANQNVQAAMSSPLTSRSYHTKEGRKVPTPKSGTFPDITTPTMSSGPIPTESEYFARTLAPPTQSINRPTRVRASSDIEMLPPASTPVPSTMDQHMGSQPQTSRVLRTRRSQTDMSSPAPAMTPAMGPPLRTHSNTKTSRAQQFSKPPKQDQSSPPLLQSTKPYSIRMAAAVKPQTPAASPTVPKTIKKATGARRSVARATTTVSPPDAPPIITVSWKPVDLSEDSVLGFATKEQDGKWFRLTASKNEHDLPTREAAREKESLFRSESVLAGFRYVFGADFDVKGKGKEVV